MVNVASVFVVAGTRPELVKLAPVVHELVETPALDVRLALSGQHYDDELSDAFIRTFSLPEPDHRLDAGRGPHASQTASTLSAVGRLLRTHEPAITIAQGDTNTTLATALAASKRPTAFAHVEAGLRSDDDSMPEEVNRVLADHVATHLYAPTATAAANLADEGLTEGVEVVGNTVVDACLAHRSVAAAESDALEQFDLSPGAFVLATVHRPRNTDAPDRLRAIVSTLDDATRPVVLPVHPRTRTALEALEYTPDGALRVVEPLGYQDFLRLLDTACVVVTDSGGVQEEAAVLETPCLTVRPNTERPETVAAGVNELVEPTALGDRLATLASDPDARAAMTGAPDLYGDGQAAERIVQHLASVVR